MSKRPLELSPNQLNPSAKLCRCPRLPRGPQGPQDGVAQLNPSAKLRRCPRLPRGPKGPQDGAAQLNPSARLPCGPRHKDRAAVLTVKPREDGSEQLLRQAAVIVSLRIKAAGLQAANDAIRGKLSERSVVPFNLVVIDTRTVTMKRMKKLLAAQAVEIRQQAELVERLVTDQQLLRVGACTLQADLDRSRMENQALKTQVCDLGKQVEALNARFN
jgi:hypothetical protein